MKYEHNNKLWNCWISTQKSGHNNIYKFNKGTTTLNEIQPRWITKEIIIQNKNKVAGSGV